MQAQKQGEKLVKKFGEGKTAEEYVALVAKDFAKTTQQYYLWCLGSAVKDPVVAQSLKDASWRLKKGLEAEAKKQEKTEEQEENWLEWEKMEAARKAAKKLEGKKGHWMHLIMCLYTEIPPLRLDWADVEVTEKAPTDPKQNWMSLKKATLYLVDYKTAKTHGAQEIAIPPSLLSTLKASLTEHPRKYVLSSLTDADAPLNEAQLSQMIRAAFEETTGRSVTLQLLRRIWASHSLKGAPSIKQMEEDAKALQHSVAVHHVYRKL